jgi:hypothetical protein
MIAIIAACAACKKESKKEDVAPTVKPKSRLELLCQTWTLHETYENSVLKTSSGTGQYQFTRQGNFKHYYNNSWNDIGTFDFTGSDSTAISVVFMGSTNPIGMSLEQINETILNTRFNSGGKSYLYKYKR